MSDAKRPTARGDFLMLNVDDFAGAAVDVAGDEVSVAFYTKEGPSIDFTMSKEQAAYLGHQLVKATK